MTNKNNILLICPYSIISRGINALLSEKKLFCITKTLESASDLNILGKTDIPDIIIINKKGDNERIINSCKKIHNHFPRIPILIFIEEESTISIPELIVNGVRGVLWKTKVEEELIDALKKLAKGGLYFQTPSACTLSCKLSKHGKESNSIDLNEELSPREIEVAKLIAEGYTYKEIAQKLFISPRTVESHKNNIINKLKLCNTTELIRFAILNEL